MRKWLIILGTVFVVSALTGWVMADDIDDVYYWPETTFCKQRNVSDVSTIDSKPVQTSKITYIEDSVTLHSDTIVKAVIHR